MQQLFFIICTLALLLAPTALNAQSADKASAGEVAVRTSLQQLKLEYEQLAALRENNKSTCIKLLNSEKTITREQNAGAMLEAILRLQFKAQAQIEQIDQERMRNVAFKGDIDSYAANAGNKLLRQEQSYLNQYIAELRNFGQQQDDDTKRMRLLIARLKKNIPRLPAPQSFVNELGMEMQLVSVKKFTPFYISATPVNNRQWNLLASRSDTIAARENDDDSPCGNIDFASASAFTQGAARFTGFKYTLPTAEQCAALGKNGFGTQSSVASWMQTPWLQDKYTRNTDEYYALGRFGIRMATVWDPACRLYRQSAKDDDDTLPLFGELPQASYPELGVYLTAPLEAGTLTRYNIVAKKVNDALAAESATDDAGEKHND